MTVNINPATIGLYLSRAIITSGISSLTRVDVYPHDFPFSKLISTMKSQTFTTEPIVWSRRNFLRKFFIPLLPGRAAVDDFLAVQYLRIEDEEEDDEDGGSWMSAIFLSLTARSSMGITTPAASLALLLVVVADDDDDEEEENQLKDGKPGKRDSIHCCQ